ncbi:IclR helix-turn-helix domain-containing protein [Streptomyces sp. yr375]|uniref:BRO-N domain-containing protein n=1 Tax=Streptomyces sp. yr375 TaxID=1761906 RepID=UPI0008BDF557|nr:Bro-N domain-containing protein [Streptomyces sp. yr375]SES28956.1 IclR helix-turn-helix domain-containing protein [Streptomyces sp. yr375]
MHEQNNTQPPHQSAAQQDAIDVNDFVFAATGARVRRLTLPDGEHWFPAVDVATELGYANTRDALRHGVAQQHTTSLDDLARSVDTIDASCNIAGHRLKKSMKMVNLRGLIQLVNGCTKPESQPFKTWVSEVIATIQRDGSYSLEPAPLQPAPTGGTAYLMPEQVADAIVRLEVRNIQADEVMAASQRQQTALLEEISRSQQTIARSQNAIAEALQDIALALRHRPAEPELTPQRLLATWKAKNLVFTEDVHAVAAYLAPALVRGEAGYRLEEIATRTGLPLNRVHDCLRTLLKRGCMRQTGCAPDGAPVYVLP